MFTFFGKIFTSIAIGVSSLFGIHSSVPATAPLVGSSTQQAVTAPEFSAGTFSQATPSAAKVVPAKTNIAPAQTKTQAVSPEDVAPPLTSVPPSVQEILPSNTSPSTSSVDTGAQERQVKVNSITAQCNSQINSLNQQIIDMKNDYYKQVTAIENHPSDLAFQNGRISKLTSDTNQKIAEIDLQIQQIQLDCQKKFNQL